jgi:galactokinase
MGGGFGGCTINLVAKDNVADVETLVKIQYKNKFNREADMYVMSLSEGTNVVTETANIRFS